MKALHQSAGISSSCHFYLNILLIILIAVAAVGSVHAGRNVLVIAFNLLLLTVGIWLLFDFWSERRFIERFAKNAVDGASHPLGEVLALAGGIIKLSEDWPRIIKIPP